MIKKQRHSSAAQLLSSRSAALFLPMPKKTASSSEDSNIIYSGSMKSNHHYNFQYFEKYKISFNFFSFMFIDLVTLNSPIGTMVNVIHVQFVIFLIFQT